VKRKRELKEALRKFKEYDDECRIKYWKIRKMYERMVQNKRCIW
jgi:hypothetical protein